MYPPEGVGAWLSDPAKLWSKKESRLQEELQFSVERELEVARGRKSVFQFTVLSCRSISSFVEKLTRQIFRPALPH